MKIFFIGCVEFSFNALQILIENQFEIVGVATKENSGFNSDHRDLAPLCIPNGIRYKYMKDVNHPNNIEFIRSCLPDVIYCFGWSSLIKEELLSSSKIGVIGYHPALLPFNRGRHPLIWALALGLKKTGSTFFFMDTGADTGDILSQEVIDISDTDNARSLYNKMQKTAFKQIQHFTNGLKTGQFDRIPQPKEGNTWRKRGRNDGRIDFRMNSITIYNLVRALSEPYVGAHIESLDGDIKVWQTEIDIEMNLPNIEPGRVLSVIGNKIRVKSADGAIWLIKHEFVVLPSVGDYL